MHVQWWLLNSISSRGLFYYWRKSVALLLRIDLHINCWIGTQKALLASASNFLCLLMTSIRSAVWNFNNLQQWPWLWPSTMTLTLTFNNDLDFDLQQWPWLWPSTMTLTLTFNNDLDFDLQQWPWLWPSTMTLTLTFNNDLDFDLPVKVLFELYISVPDGHIFTQTNLGCDRSLEAIKSIGVCMNSIYR